MELRLLIICLFFGLFACQSTTLKENSKIGQLTAALNANPTKENRAALIAAYQDTIKAKPNDATTNAPFFSKIAALHVDNKEAVAALQTLMQGIQQYPQAEGVDAKVWMLADIYQQQIQRPRVANIIKKLYAQKFDNGAQIAAAKKAMQATKTAISEDIVALGSSMYDEKTHKVDFQAANDYIRVCELYALLKPSDPQSPEYLHKAGETARAVRAFPKAVEVYDWISLKIVKRCIKRIHIR